MRWRLMVPTGVLAGMLGCFLTSMSVAEETVAAKVDKKMLESLVMERVWSGHKGMEDLTRTIGVMQQCQGLTLGRHQVVADEIGRAVEEFMYYADTAFEELTRTTWVRKTFKVKAPLDKPCISVAGYRLRGKGSLTGTFDGIPFTHQASCNNEWYGDWLIFPAPAVHRGENTLILSTTGTLVWRLFIEPSVLPNRSARSIDSGRNWDDQHLGLGGFIDGEYVIRLSGERTAGEGWVGCLPVQVAPSGRTVSPASRVVSISVSTDSAVPVEVRLGKGPWRDGAGIWTGWSRPSPGVILTMEKELGPPGPRFVQWRAHLRMRDGHAPILKSVKLSVVMEPALHGKAPSLRIDAPPTVLPGRPFAHQGNSQRLAAIRRRYRLDEVYASGSNEWKGLLHLAAWVGSYCYFRGTGPFEQTARYDVVEILQNGHAGISKVLCGHLAFAFVQLACAYGHTARVILRGNHLVTEVWSPVHRKWAVVDTMDQLRDAETDKWVWTPGFGGYYHRGDNVPMSAIELGKAKGKVTRTHLVWQTGKFASRPATQERDLRWYRWEVSYPERNNYTDAYEPVFYADVFRFAGHLKYCRGREKLMPYYWRYTSRRGDLEWTIGETATYVTALAPGKFVVQFDSRLPNTAYLRLEPSAGKALELSADNYTWEPAKVGGRLIIRAVGKLGVEGPETTCTLLSE